MAEEKQTVNKDMTIGEVVKKYPQTVPVFFKHGLACVGCHVANWETVEQGAVSHGIQNLDDLIRDLNKVAAPAAA
jgi:hybrid cluster-associated redox disulfide protein